MRRITISFLFAAAMLLPSAGFAKETIGDFVLEFDQKLEADTNGNGVNDRTSYYLGDTLVWSAYDEDEDGELDLYLRYKNGDTVDLELRDPDGDGEPDKMAEFDTQGKREVVYDADAEFAGGSSFSSNMLLLVLFAAAGVGYWYFKLRKVSP